MSFFSIGHSNLEISQFLSLLKANEVSAICDVRTSPSSRYTPQFNRELLRNSLSRVGIGYHFLGEKLGGRPSDTDCYDGNQVNYVTMATKPWFHKGISELLAIGDSGRVALMCSEKDPLNCHRFLLVSRHLASRNHSISHILSDGKIESQGEVESRLFSLNRIPNTDLFQSQAELLDKAYKIQAGKVSYVAEADGRE